MKEENKNTDLRETQNVKGENRYGSILKRVSAFGGVQIFNILINLVRGKFVAMFLGPEGMGISSMLTSSTATLQQFCSLGLNLAFVKEVSAARVDKDKLETVVRVATSLIIVTSLLGAIVCAAFSPWLSEWSFGTRDFTSAYIALGLFVGLSIAGNGYLAMLQGIGSVKRLAKASLVGSLTGLFCSVPLYYFFGYKGIVPAMIIMSTAIFLFYYTGFKGSVRISGQEILKDSSLPLVKRMISIGFILMIGTLIGSAVNFGINAYVRATGNIGDVGLFQAANSLTNQYMGVVFSALAMDYFPRLAASKGKISLMSTLVNRQTEVVLLIATPLVLCVMVAAPLIIDLLLTSDFQGIRSLLRWLAFGILVQAWVFPMNYLYVANDNRKVYFWMEAVESNAMWLTCSIVFYNIYGLIGLGYSLVARGILDMGISYCVCRSYYGFSYRSRTLLIIWVNLLLGAAGCFFCETGRSDYSLPALIVLVISALFSLISLRKLRND